MIIKQKRKSSDSYYYNVYGPEEIRNTILTINKYPNIDYIYIKKYWYVRQYLCRIEDYPLIDDLINYIIRLWYKIDVERLSSYFKEFSTLKKGKEQ